ncbi:hypothetical protein SE17_39990 [Kouleothrix aurantiaca]|uniref:Oligopeptide/dipeptide ABC transporter C-terminal domain-containing protein n=1 Tax=Kouleothrix aurantiaca TaxID=186479 RepID=A0A0P9CQX1_9CHLR|nr:hypothetical protein SE17_39990 [Kouleothrix aurantiaca]
MEEADTPTLFAEPLRPYTQHLIRSLPKIDDRSVCESLPGRPPALDNPPSGCRFHPRWSRLARTTAWHASWCWKTALACARRTL